MIRDQETLDALLDSVRRFVCVRLVPAENEVAETDAVPPAIVDEMRRMGLFGLSIPEAYGGLELTMEEEVRVLFELCQTSPAFRSNVRLLPFTRAESTLAPSGSKTRSFLEWPHSPRTWKSRSARS